MREGLLVKARRGGPVPFDALPLPAPYFHSHFCEPVCGSVHIEVRHTGRCCHLHIDLTQG